jgi:endonuclease/exonuclease/phosphatase family metal-dependent hydrolase
MLPQKKVNTYLMERMASCRGRQVIVLGDFNVDLKKKEVPFQALKDMKQHIQAPTTDYMSILDHIYTNIVDIQTGVFESYFKDHKPVWIKLKRPN